MILNKIDDPRDNLEKARRPELVRFAQSKGLHNITEAMPAILIRRELRSRGLTNIQIPRRVLGSQNQNGATMPAAMPADQKVVEVNAEDDLARQFRQQPPPPSEERPRRLVERPRQEINVLRDTCKRLGIKMGRRDNLDSLKAKIEAHGKDAA